TDAWTEVPQMERATLISKKGEVSIEKWQPESRLLRVRADANDTLRIRTFNFPGWTATVNGAPAPIITGTTYQEITIPLAAGESKVQIEYLDTPVRQLGKRITQLAFVILLALMITPLLVSRNTRR